MIRYGNYVKMNSNRLFVRKLNVKIDWKVEILLLFCFLEKVLENILDGIIVNNNFGFV